MKKSEVILKITVISVFAIILILAVPRVFLEDFIYTTLMFSLGVIFSKITGFRVGGGLARYKGRFISKKMTYFLEVVFYVIVLSAASYMYGAVIEPLISSLDRFQLLVTAIVAVMLVPMLQNR